MRMVTLNVLEVLEATQVFERKLNLALLYSGLRLPQFKVMDFLEKAGKITVSDLSRHLSVTRATMSVLVTALIKADIVEKIMHHSDKRSFYIKLTESGFNRLEFARKEVELVVKKISNDFSEEIIIELNNFSRIITRDR